MKYRIGKSFEFSAAHRLVAPYEGKCSRLHGHTWRVEIVVCAEVLDSSGMVVDFSDFAPLKEYLAQRFDHSTINDTVAQPTAENIARYLFDWSSGRWSVFSVRVYESSTSWAEYTR